MRSNTTTADEDYGPRAEGEREKVPYLFLVLQAHDPGRRGARYCLKDVDVVSIGRGDEHSAERRKDGARTRLEIRTPARSMSVDHAEIDVTKWHVRDVDSKNGTFRNGVRITRSPVADGDVLEMGRTFFIVRTALSSPKKVLFDEMPHHLLERPVGLRTLLPDLFARFETLLPIAKSDIPVLLRGATGSGKEVLARAIHRQSMRPGDFVAVNCGALPGALVESMLFGHKKGAFSGAVGDELGFIRAADKGTLLLDEIAELPMPSQAALLRVLQEREVVPVGATKPVPVDIRIIAATHRPLEALIESGGFRSDLLARLKGMTFVMPSLRERREDLGVIIADLLEQIAPDRARNLSFAPEAARALLRYDWPLNVRELFQCLRAAVMLTTDDRITLLALPEDVALVAEDRRAKVSRPEPIAEVELSGEDHQLKDALVEALTRNEGNVAAVARAMGKAPIQIHRWMKRLAIDPNRYRR
jgi:transcriptional regulator of acetoin/glycerol metabolism